MLAFVGEVPANPARFFSYFSSYWRRLRHLHEALSNEKGLPNQ
jgi:hypothetical protein